MTVFLVLGVVGLLVVALSLFAGDLLDGALDALEADWISSAVLGGFTSALGFGGAAALATGLPWPPALAIGGACGVGVGWLAWQLTHLLKDGPSDGTVTMSDTVGQVGRVITSIPEGGYGVIRLAVGGHTITCNAVSASPVEPGAEVHVTEVVSPSAVRVTAVWQLGSTAPEPADPTDPTDPADPIDPIEPKA